MKRLIKKDILAAPRKTADDKLRELSSGKVELLQDYFWDYMQSYIINNKESLADIGTEQIYEMFFDNLQPGDVEQCLTIHTKITSNQLTNEFSSIINRLKFMFNDLKYEIAPLMRELFAE